MIEVNNLSKTFRVHKKAPGLRGSLRSLFKREWIIKDALKNVSLEIGAGEIVGLVGANGAGKTTLIKILAGIIYPSSGRARVLGFDPWDRQKDFRRQIALIMGQKAQLWWDLPAEDCFLLLKEIYQIPERKFRERLGYLARTLEVESLLNFQIRRLSLGERMKMELIAALLHQPRVVFLDEPTIGLDITAQRAIRKFILEYRKEHRPAMIVTSHYMEDIERLCERIVVIREGRFVYDGPLKTIVSQHAQHKSITARVDLENREKILPQDLAAFPAELGELTLSDSGALKIKVLRENVPLAATALIQRFPITDLDIEEEDISNIIESIMRGRN